MCWRGGDALDAWVVDWYWEMCGVMCRVRLCIHRIFVNSIKYLVMSCKVGGRECRAFKVNANSLRWCFHGEFDGEGDGRLRIWSQSAAPASTREDRAREWSLARSQLEVHWEFYCWIATASRNQRWRTEKIECGDWDDYATENSVSRWADVWIGFGGFGDAKFKDSCNAFKVINALKGLCLKMNTSVVCSVHQPSSVIFRATDCLLVMSKGCLIFNGPALDSIEFFSRKGFECPVYMVSIFRVFLLTS